MPERIIRPGIRSSDKVAENIRNGGWLAQVFYDWLLTVVDDFGRYDARPALLRSEVFPILQDMVREADVSRCLAACEKAGLIRLYAYDGKAYLEVTKWRQRLRAAKSKWPAPPRVTVDVRHPHDIVVTMPTETETETETEPPTPARGGGGRVRSAGKTEPTAAVFPSGFASFWAAWPAHQRKKGRSKCAAFWTRKKLEPMADVVVAAVHRFRVSPDWQREGGRFIPGPEPWLNDESWEVPASALSPSGNAANDATLLADGRTPDERLALLDDILGPIEQPPSGGEDVT